MKSQLQLDIDREQGDRIAVATPKVARLLEYHLLESPLRLEYETYETVAIKAVVRDIDGHSIGRVDSLLGVQQGRARYLLVIEDPSAILAALARRATGRLIGPLDDSGDQVFFGREQVPASG